MRPIRPNPTHNLLIPRPWGLALLFGLGACGAPSEVPRSPSDAPLPISDADQDGFTVDDGDCDDQDPTIHPGAPDVPYDSVDSDCDGASDFDADRDGFDAASHGGLDCNDTDGAVFPGATERCNHIDDDCDGAIDLDDDDLVDGLVRYVDGDGDGFGDVDTPVMVCAESKGFVADASDCDDQSADTHPGAVPVACDGRDNDCDPTTPEPPVVRVDGVVEADLDDAFQAASHHSTIVLCEGVYEAPSIHLSEDRLTLRGAGPELTLIDGQGQDRVLYTRGEDVVIEGLTMANGDVRTQGDDERGGCIWVRGGRLTLVDVVVRDCRSTDNGGAIYLDPGTELVLERVTLRNNETARYGGAIATAGHLLSEGGTVRATDTVIRENRASSGAGIQIWDGSFDGGGSTLIEGNVAVGVIGVGGARMLESDLIGVEISRNHGAMIGLYDNGAGGLEFVRDGRIEDVMLVDNVGEPPGAVIGRGDTTVTRLTVLDHTNATSRAVLEIHGGNTVVTDSTFHRNTAALAFLRFSIDAIAQEPATLQLISTDFGTGPTANPPTDIVFSFGDTVDIDGVIDLECTTDDVTGTCI
ncbi:MAG: MopE-related protein [Myxococcota bacterium]